MKALTFSKAGLRSIEECINHFDTSVNDDYAVSMLFHVFAGNHNVIMEKDLKTGVSTIRKVGQLKKMFRTELFNLLPISLKDDEDKKRSFPIADKYGHKNFKDINRTQITVAEEIGLKAFQDKLQANTGSPSLKKEHFTDFVDLLDAYLSAKAEAAKTKRDEEAAVTKTNNEKALAQFVKANRHMSILPEAKQKEAFKQAQTNVNNMVKAVEALKLVADATKDEAHIVALHDAEVILEELKCYAEGRMMDSQKRAYDKADEEAARAKAEAEVLTEDSPLLQA